MKTFRLALGTFAMMVAAMFVIVYSTRRLLEISIPSPEGNFSQAQCYGQWCIHTDKTFRVYFSMEGEERVNFSFYFPEPQFSIDDLIAVWGPPDAVVTSSYWFRVGWKDPSRWAFTQVWSYSIGATKR